MGNQETKKKSTNDSLLEDALNALALKGSKTKKARKILTVALETKEISTYDISLLLSHTNQSHIVFKTTVTELVRILLENGIQPHFIPKKDHEKNKGRIKKSPISKDEKAQESINQKILSIDDENDSPSKTTTDIEPGETYQWFMNTAGNHSILEHSRVCELIYAAQQGNNEARNKVMLHNQKLVSSIAQKYNWNNRDIMDLIQEGNFGLIEAIENFDESVGTRFSTYATWWIKQKIRRSIQDHGNTVRIPVHMQEEVAAYNKARNTLMQQIGRDPSDIEIFQFMERKNSGVVSEMTRFGISSTDEQIGSNVEGESSAIGETIPNEQEYSADQIMTAKEVLKEYTLKVRLLVELVKKFEPSKRNRRIFFLYHNLDKTPLPAGNTLEIIGDEFDISRERARQIIHSVWVRLHGKKSPINKKNVKKQLTTFHLLEDFTKEVIDL